MQSKVILALAAASVASAQFVPPPAPVLLTSTKSGVLPVLPTPFSGVETLEGAIMMKAPANASYLPVNGPAQVQSNLPAATYVATLPQVAFDELTGTIISGTVTASAAQGATGVTFTFNLTGFPNLAMYGPFAYHIHNMPVPADGNCTSTLGHFDYTNAGEYYTCNTPTPQNCQIGDLAGKHGKINATSFMTSYTDNYLSTDPNSPYFFGAKSFLIHTSNTTRITCANFMQVGGSSASNSTSTPAGPVMSMTASSPVMSMTGSATSSGPVASYTANAAARVAGGVGAGLAALGAVLLM